MAREVDGNGEYVTDDFSECIKRKKSTATATEEETPRGRLLRSLKTLLIVVGMVRTWEIKRSSFRLNMDHSVKFSLSFFLSIGGSSASNVIFKLM